MSAAPIPLGEVAQRLGVHYMTAYRYVRLGELAAVQHEGRWVVDPAELERFRSRPRAPAGRPPAGRPRPTSSRLASRLEERLLAGDEPAVRKLAEAALAAGTSDEDLYVGGFGAALRSIGEKWAHGSVSIAQEHEASRVAERVIARLGSGRARRGRRLGTAVLAAPAGEQHVLPLSIVGELLRAHGLQVVDLGANAPAAEIVAAAARDRVVGIGLCVTSPLDEPGRRRFVRDEIRHVQDEGGPPVVVGGSAIASREMADELGIDEWTATAAEAVGWFVGAATSRRGGA